MTSRQLDPEFKSAVVNGELGDSALVLLSMDAIVYSQQLGLGVSNRWTGIWNGTVNVHNLDKANSCSWRFFFLRKFMQSNGYTNSNKLMVKCTRE